MEGFRFKTVVLGTSDAIKAKFLSLISQRSWNVDGVSGFVHKEKEVALDIWFPHENASSKILVSFSFTDVNGVIIVMGRRDRRILNQFKQKIKKDIGKIPSIGVVLRKSMTESEKAVQSLNAIKILSEKMKSIASENAKMIQQEETPPKAIAGKPIYKMDEFGFIVQDSESGVTLFSEEPDNTKSSKLKSYK